MLLLHGCSVLHPWRMVADAHIQLCHGRGLHTPLLLLVIFRLVAWDVRGTDIPRWGAVTVKVPIAPSGIDQELLSRYIGTEAQMAELVDALDSGSSGGNPVEVQVLFWASS